MKGWRNLGIVKTIHEEEDDGFSSSSSPSLEQTDLSSPYTPLRSRVEEWSSRTGCKPDVFIHVRGTRFHLHKDPLSKRSAYLKRKVTGFSELTLSPPLNLTAETFSLIADFCYGAHISLTPFNVASLRIAAELLQMTDGDNGDEDDENNLRQITETYFRQAVAVNREYTVVILRSCLKLLPESETTAFLVGRCIEALRLTEDCDGLDRFFVDVVTLPPEDFITVAAAVQRRFSRHDLLYRIVDSYIKEQNNKITEERKIQLCSFIDCGKLSPHFLLHAIQNPKMPLRFLIRAMLAEQLNMRRAISLSANRSCGASNAGKSSKVTLGSILRRHSAARQTAQLRAAMDVTGSRIELLEKQLGAMKQLVSQETEKGATTAERVGSSSILESGRSASFHCITSRNNNDNNKIERGEKGSVSSLSLRFGRGGGAVVMSSSPSSTGSGRESPKAIRRNSIGQKLINGLKSAFGVSKQGDKKSALEGNEIGGKKKRYEDDYAELEDFVWIRENEDGDDYVPSCYEKKGF